MYSNLLSVARTWVEKGVVSTAVGVWWLHALVLVAALVLWWRKAPPGWALR